MSDAPGQMQVLHVDDDPDLVDVTASLLERHLPDATVVTETDPRAVLDRLSTTDVDCVVSDYEMPGMDGLELLRAVRAEYPDLPFVLYTGKGSEEIASEAISAGVTDYIQKRAGAEQYDLLTTRIANAVERYRAHRQRDASRRRYRALLDLAPNPVAVIQDGVVAEANDETAELLGGTDRSDVVGREAPRFIHPEERERMFERFQRLLEGDADRVPRVERHMLTLDGDDLYVEVTDTAIPYEGSQAVLVYGVDVTDRKEHERELAYAETALSTVQEAVYVLDAGEEFVFVNDAFVDLTGYDRPAVVGEHVSVLTGDPDADDPDTDDPGPDHDPFVDDGATDAATATLVPDAADPVDCEVRFGDLSGREFDGTVAVVREVED